MFSGGLAAQEYTGTISTTSLAVQFVRGFDWGGGVGGLLYSVRGGTPSFKHYNARGDILAESNATGATTWRAQYDAYGTRSQESGTPSADRQRGNTKDEDPSGLRNDGERYYDLDAQIYLTPDPAGFADGPNVYTYVEQNPWSRFDPDGQFWHILAGAAIGAGLDIATQLIANGKVSDWGSVAKSAAGGAVGAATGAIIGQVATRVAAVSRTAAAGVRAYNTVMRRVRLARSTCEVETCAISGEPDTVAYDQRFAIAYVASSGLGGAGLYRRNFGEILANVAGWTEYHWMAGNFVKYASDPLTAADLPVDGHALLALCAPRPVLVTVGSLTGPVGSNTAGDWWADPVGTWLTAAAAAPVYALLGDRPLAPAGTSATPPSALPNPQLKMPAVETALTGGALAFRQHTGGHADAPNWPAFLDLAARYFRAPVAAPPEAAPSAGPR